MASDAPTSSSDPGEGRARSRKDAFIAASIGALVGGLFSVGVARMTLDAQADRESEAQRRLATGTARVMIGAFDNAVVYLCRVGKDNRFLDISPHFRPEVATADRTLVSGELEPEEALAVAEGDQAMARWEELYRKNRHEFAGREEEFNPFNAGLDRGIRRAMRARLALEATADYDSSGSPGCDRDTWEVEPPDPSRRGPITPEDL